jgi:hypothetical protein
MGVGVRRDWTHSVRQKCSLVKAVSGTVLLRFAHEMNGDWFPWGQQPTLCKVHNGHTNSCWSTQAPCSTSFSRWRISSTALCRALPWHYAVLGLPLEQGCVLFILRISWTQMAMARTMAMVLTILATHSLTGLRLCTCAWLSDCCYRCEFVSSHTAHTSACARCHYPGFDRLHARHVT